MNGEVIELIDEAVAAMDNAHAPYSGCDIGAAVRGSSGDIYSACNIECKPTTNTLHAEARAVSKAIEAGEDEIDELALSTSGDGAAPPCGNCLQTICTFGREVDIYVVVEHNEEKTTFDTHSSDVLLPRAYTDRDDL